MSRKSAGPGSSAGAFVSLTAAILVVGPLQAPRHTRKTREIAKCKLQNANCKLAGSRLRFRMDGDRLNGGKHNDEKSGHRSKEQRKQPPHKAAASLGLRQASVNERQCTP